ncbi:MAG: beta strand repeat-containing protein, partial [Thermoleophilia bacterium]
MKAKQHGLSVSSKGFLVLGFLVFAVLLFNLAFTQNAQAASAKVINASATGGECTTVGTWDAATKTCTLTADIDATGKNGIEITADGITLDGNGHSVTGSGGFTTGVSLSVRNNVTVKNLTVSNFNYGFYLLFSNNSKIFNNNTTVANIPVYAAGGSGNVFDQASPANGNYWEKFDTPAEGCNDINADGICDAAYVFTGGRDNTPWTSASGWLVPPAPDTDPPVVTSVTPSGIINTGSTTISVSYNDSGTNVNTSSVVVSLDGTPLSGCTVTTSGASCPVTGLALGSHVIGGSVSDNVGNTAPIAGGFTLADNTAPVVSNVMPSGAISTSSTTVTASYSDDLSGINAGTVSVLMDGAAVSGCTAGASSVSCPVSGLAEGSHSIAVNVSDNSGNTGSGSGSVVVDTIAPSVTNLQPTGTITTSSTTISANYSDSGSGIDSSTAAVTLDGATLSGCSASATVVSCPASAIASGTHTIGVSVRDAAGNNGTASSSFQVVAPDTTAPTVSNITPSGWISTNNPTINADLADLGGAGVNAASAAVRLDGGAPLSGCTATTTHISCPTSGLAVGGHSISVSVSDGVGNNGSGSASFSIDISAPTVSSILPTGTINANATTLSANYADGGAGVNSASAVVTLDGTTVPGCTASAGNVSCLVSGIADGVHAITVTVNDNAGNTGTGSGSFTVDTTVSPEITTNTNYLTNNGTGGSCTAIGIWDPATLTCTLTTDIKVNSGKNGLEFTSNGITVDGNGHKITSLGGFGTGVSMALRSDNTVKNTTIKSFRYGVYLTASSNVSIFNNNFDSNYISAYVSGGSGNTFDQPMPAGGNYWSNFSTPAQGCEDLNVDGRCDAVYVFTGSQDNNPWTGVNGWTTPPVADTTAPTVSNVSPSGVITSSSASVSASLFDGESGVKTSSVVVTLDGGSMLGCTVTTTSVSCPASGLAAGAHNIGGSVADNAGNSTPISGSFTVVDTTAPVVSGLAPSGAISSTSSTISASFSDDLSGVNVATAVVTLDASTVSGCTVDASGVSCPVSGLAEGDHSLNVSVQDNSSNTGSASGTFQVDTIAPAVSNMLPTGTITTSTATISADYADGGSGINVASASIRLDGALLPMSDCTANAVNISCTATALASGTHTISVSVADAAGNAGSGNSSFNVVAPDTTPPTASNITPSGWIMSTSPTIDADLNDLGGAGVNAASATISIDSGAALTGCTANITHISCPSSGLAAGAHTITVNVSDNSGNAGSGSGSFNIDTAAPTVSGLAPTGSIYVSSSTLSASYSDAASGINMASATVTLDGTAVIGCTATATGISCPVTGLTNATHTMEVSVSDNAGNTGSNSDSFIVDTTVSPEITTNTNTITSNSTGGACATIGSWNPSTLTCTLTTDIRVNTGKNGIVVNSSGITIDGNGHKITSNGGLSTGVSFMVMNNVTVKNLTIRQFNYGVYLLASNNAKVFNNNFISNNTQAYVSGGSGNVFTQPAPAGGNYWSNFNTPAQGCEDANTDGLCDGAFVFTGGSDNSAWTYASAWGISDSTPPSVTNVMPTGTINSGSTTVSAGFSDSGSGINQSSATVSVDGTALTGCTKTASSISCPASGLALGVHTISGSVADSAGNTAPISGSFNVVDNTGPAVTNIQPSGTITVDSATISAAISDDLSGVNSSTVAVYLDGARMSGCTATASNVSCSAAGLANGAHSIAVEVDDNSGNHGTGNGSFTVSTDTTAPAITNIQPSGWIGTSSTTVSASYSDAGTGINASTVSVSVDGATLAGCTAGASSVSCPASGLAAGSHSISVSVADNAGNNGTGSGSFSVDMTAPSVTDVVPSGPVNTTSVTVGGSYSDAGSGIDSASAAVYVDGAKVTGCTATATSISCPGIGVASGSHTVQVSVSDNTGARGSNNGTFNVDIAAPVIGTMSPSGTTTNASPILSINYSDGGSGINAAAVVVYLDGSVVTGCTAGPNNVSCPVSSLAQGNHNISVYVADNAGNSSSGAGSFNVDTIPPAVTNVQPTGWVGNTSATITANYMDSGSGINSATAMVYLDSSAVTGCIITSSAVSCPVSALTQGSHNISVTVKDNGGNTGTGTSTFSVDTIAPSVTDIAPSGTIATNSATISAYVSDTGSGINSATADVYLDGVKLTTCTVDASSVSCPASGISDGNHSISVSVKDNVGNNGSASGIFTVDTTVPDTTPPTVSDITPSGNVTSTSATIGAYLNDSGSGINTASVSVSVDTVALTGCTVAAGSVSCPASGLAEGAHTIDVSATDNAGNTGTGTGSFTVDSLSPAVTGLAPTGLLNANVVILEANLSDSGTGIDTASASVSMDGAPVSGCMVTATNISCPTSPADGAHSYTVSVKDTAGNTGSASASFTVDTTAPSVTGVTPSGTITSAATTVYANYTDATSGINTASVSVSIDSVALTGCTVAAGSVSCPASGLAEGAHNISVSATDNAGNTGTGTGSFTVDSLSPAVTGLAPTGLVNSADQTISASFSDSGTGIDSATAQVYMDSGLVSGCTASATGVSCPTTGLAQGDHSYTVSVADTAGNTGSASASFTVDSAAPAVSGILPSGIINSAATTVYANYTDAVSGINTASVSVSVDTVALTGCTVAAGSVSCPASGLANGNHTIDVSVADNAGNTGTGTGSFMVDTAAPAVTNLQPTGWLNTSSTTVTADYTDTGSGIDSATAQVYMDSGLVTGCTATATSISCPVTGLAEGAHNYTVSVKNMAGNTGSASASFTVDTAGPAVSGILPSGTITSAATTVYANYTDATSGINTASVSVSVDTVALSGCTVAAGSVSCSASGLAEGAHTIDVSATDNAGNTGTGTGSFTVDSLSPAVTGLAPTGLLNANVVILEANLSDSGTGIDTASASVSMDGAPVSGCMVTATNISCPTSPADGAHSYTVSVKDTAGNTGSASASFTVDTTAPSVTGVTPSGTITSAATTVYANYTDATSGINTASVSVSIDSVALTGCTVAAGSVSCPASGLAEGAHNISVSATDNAGNTGTGTGSFTVDSLSPAVTGLAPTGLVNSADQTISASFSDSGTGIDSATAQVYMDSGLVSGCTASATGVSCPTTGLAQGDHSYTVSVADTAGNTGSASASFTVDSAAPAVSGILPSGIINSAATTVYANYTDATSGINTASVSVSVDTVALTGCTVAAGSVSCPASGLAEGAHAISVSVADNAGNTGTGTGSFTVDTVVPDTTAPSVTNVLPSGTITTTSSTVSAYYSDAESGINSATAAITLDGSAMTGCTATASTISCAASGLADGAHTIGVSVADMAGNSGTGSGSFTVDATAPA